MTLADVRARLEARIADAERMKATAPGADVLRVVLAELGDVDGEPDAGGPGDRLLTAEEAALMLGVTVRWCYDHAKRLPFAKRLSRKCLRFSEAGLRRYLARRAAA